MSQNNLIWNYLVLQSFFIAPWFPPFMVIVTTCRLFIAHHIWSFLYLIWPHYHRAWHYVLIRCSNSVPHSVPHLKPIGPLGLLTFLLNLLTQFALETSSLTILSLPCAASLYVPGSGSMWLPGSETAFKLSYRTTLKVQITVEESAKMLMTWWLYRLGTYIGRVLL